MAKSTPSFRQSQKQGKKTTLTDNRPFTKSKKKKKNSEAGKKASKILISSPFGE